MESKKEKFVRLAEQRVNNIFEQLRKLGNLSNRSNYEYDEEKINKIFLEINRLLRKTKAQFYKEDYQKPPKFKF